MAREVVLYIAASLDGYIARADDNLDWLTETESEGDAGYAEMYQSIDTVLMGKRTYDWLLEHTDAFPYPDKKCYVFSTTEKGSTDHVEFVNEDVLAFTRKLKEEDGAKIWMVGGGGILDAFIKHHLIDEYIITVTPHILGAGIPLFKANNPEIHLFLKESRRYGQFVQMHYLTTRDGN
ncbi:dihydrofolate reductase family protein [Paenibacillus sp. 1001270B_150601_E10]|uniref:dihydrofolate reductase family protein n=1 Tax=Paenibacillus sp. 1001270B_150601_E10 TaxID=2787079 RepID=UPI00189F820D|nr:dihydrofolate reductase family protein [Paenibacillus sp. 1001270B_150601_E10]